MKRGLTAVAGVFLLLFAVPASAGSGPGSSAAPFLKIGAGARWAALGGAGSALSTDPYCLTYNPAGLSAARTPAIAAQFTSSFADIDYQYLGYSHPTTNGAVGIGIIRVGYGDEERTLADANGNYAGTAGTFSASDMAVRIGYGRRLPGGLGIGVSAGWVNQKIDDVSGSGFILDGGVRYEDPSGRFVLAGSIMNLGSEIKLVNDGFRPPVQVRIGTAYRHSPALRLVCDAVYSEDSNGDINAGVEYTLARSFDLRLGYGSMNDAGSGITAGLGFKTQGASIDYAFVPYGDLGQDHRVSLTYAFGGGGMDGDLAMPAYGTAATDEDHAAATMPAPAPSPEVRFGEAPSHRDSEIFNEAMNELVLARTSSE